MKLNRTQLRQIITETMTEQAGRADGWKFNEESKTLIGDEGNVALSVGTEGLKILIKTVSGQEEFYYVPLYGIKMLLRGK
jgi:hypothetical protein